MSTALLEQVVSGKAPRLLALTLKQYHAICDAGIFGDAAPLELIDGYVMHKDRGGDGGPTMISPRHTDAVTALLDLAAPLKAMGFHFRSQQPLTLPPDSEPEPDGVVIRGPREAMRNRRPAPADVAAVIEVSESSLRYDRTTKHRLYASAGIPLYWIVNLVDGQVESHADPLPSEGRYTRLVAFGRNQSAPLDLGHGQSLVVPVNDLIGA